MPIQICKPAPPNGSDRTLQTPVPKLQRGWPVGGEMDSPGADNTSGAGASGWAGREAAPGPGTGPGADIAHRTPGGWLRSRLGPWVAVCAVTLAVSAAIWVLIQ